MKVTDLVLRRIVALIAAGAVLLLSGCATVIHPVERDPWQSMNRATSQFNEGLDAMLLKPAATVYKGVVPAMVRTGVSNFFSNLGDAWSVVNNLLQFKLQNAEESLARFHINTMFGLLGIFDVASDLDIDRHEADFGQTLAHWGVPAGPYLVLPFFGPSSLREAAALPVSYHADLLRHIPSDSVRVVGNALRAVDIRSNLLRASDVLEEAALDKYSFVRDAYLQRRGAATDGPSADDGAEPPLEPASGATATPVAR